MEAVEIVPLFEEVVVEGSKLTFLRFKKDSRESCVHSDLLMVGVAAAKERFVSKRSFDWE